MRKTKPNPSMIRDHRDALLQSVNSMDVLGAFFRIEYPSDVPNVTCQPDIRFAWDQWAMCKITCPHGEYRGVSGFTNNFTEAYASARRKWAAADHSVFED
jgi:hypothetical protein